MEEKEIEITTLEQFMEKFGGKEASEFKKILNNKYNYAENLQFQYNCFLEEIFKNLSNEEKLKFTVANAMKIKCLRFVRAKFFYIKIGEERKNKLNAYENLRNLAKILKENDEHFLASQLSDFCISYYCQNDSDSTNDFFLQEFRFTWFNLDEIEILVDYRDSFIFIDEPLTKFYASPNFETESFLSEIKKNPKEVFDYLTKCVDVMKNNFLVYFKEKNILDSGNKQEQDAQNVQAKEIEGNKFNKFCEVIKLFFAGLVSSGSIASIIVGVIAFVSLLTLPFSPWILVGVGVPVLIVGGIFFGKSVKNLRNLSSMVNESNVKEEKSDDNSVIPKENDRSESEIQEEEEEKNKNDLYH